LTAKEYLDEADAPQDNRAFVIGPGGLKDMLGIDKFVRYDALGTGEARINTGKIGVVYNIPVYITTNVTTESASPNVVHGLMFHKDAFGLAMQKDMIWEKNRSPKGLSDIYICQALWGYSELRDDHAVDFRYAE
jgi:hypothetical protein